MASKTGFKQQCPHCEAIVPIKDEELIGKRIRCPKCNEPFRVEDLEGVAATTKTAKPAKSDAVATKKKSGAKQTPADDDDEQPKFKKKKGDSNKLLIGLGLAGVAVVLLVVAVIFVVQSNSTPSKTASTPSKTAASRTATPEPEKTTKPDEGAASPIALASLSNITNMLPTDTHMVINLPMATIRDNPVGQKMFRDNLGASLHDAGRMGFALNDVERWIIALGLNDPVWYFHIIRTTQPVKLDVLKKTLQLKPAPGGPVQGQDYFVTPVNWADTAKMLPEGLKPTGEPSVAGSDTHPLYVRLHDAYTLVIADQYPMKKFLDVKGQFEPQKPLPTDQAQNNSPFGNFPGGSPFGNPGGRGRPGGGLPPGVAPGLPPIGGGPGQLPGANTPAAPSVGNYLTINPRLKQMLDRVERNTPYLCSAARDLKDDEYSSYLAYYYFKANASFRTAGFSFQWKPDNKMIAVASVECESDEEANSLRQGIDRFLQPYFSLPANNPILQVKRGRERPDNPQGGGLNPSRPGFPGGPNRPGFPPGGEGNPRNPNQPNRPQQQIPPLVLIHIDLNVQGPWVNLASDINLREEVRNRMLGWLEPYLVRMQGEFEMGMAQPNPYQLSAAALNLAGKDQEFPRGTDDRKPSAARAGRAWPADQRVSWMAELLPYLGYEQVFHRIKREQSWRDAENLVPASVLVPNFLAPGTLRNTWYISYPGIGPELAATHFVGMAGVGLDAAGYPPDHPDVGIFNYDRRTPLARVKDKSRTILMIQVPPGLHSPWIAGGGSTIRGVPETKSIEPFLTLNEDRQRGTTVLMADGSVRWISGKVSDDVVKAMCRLKGDKSNINLSQFRPLPKPEEQAELKATPKAPATPAPKAEEKKPAPAPATKPAPAAPAPKAGSPPAAAAPKTGAPPASK